MDDEQSELLESENSPLLAEIAAHLLTPSNSSCWWCQSRPATTGEHKFKRTDLSRLMGDTALIWGDGTGARRWIAGNSGITRDRYRIVKFPKSLCEQCNNKRSKPLDSAYDIYSAYVHTADVRDQPGIDFEEVYGEDWADSVLNLARYHAKHFGCRFSRDSITIPQSLREFLNGADDMPDAHMALVTTDEVERRFPDGGLSISPNAVTCDRDFTTIKSIVCTSYIGSIGIRYEWQSSGIPAEERSQFFHYPYPVLNRFATENDVVSGETNNR